MRACLPWLAAACAALLLCSAASESLPEKKVLVLLEEPSLRASHSVFFGDLRKQGFNLHIRSAEDKSLRLRDWDDWLYGKLIIFASKLQGASCRAGECLPSCPVLLWLTVLLLLADFGGAVDSEGILEFVDGGGGLLLATDHRASDELRGLVSIVQHKHAALAHHHWSPNCSAVEFRTVQCTGTSKKMAVDSALLTK